MDFNKFKDLLTKELSELPIPQDDFSAISTNDTLLKKHFDHNPVLLKIEDNIPRDIISFIVLFQKCNNLN